MRIEVLVDVKTILGEGPLWDVEEQRLYWIDSFGMNVFRCTPDGREIRAWDLPQKIGSLALRKKGRTGSSRSSFFRFRGQSPFTRLRPFSIAACRAVRSG